MMTMIIISKLLFHSVLIVITLFLFHQVHCDAFSDQGHSRGHSCGHGKVAKLGANPSTSTVRVRHNQKQHSIFGKNNSNNIQHEHRVSLSFPTCGVSGGSLSAIPLGLSGGAGAGANAGAVIFNNAPFNLSTGIFAAANGLGLLISLCTGSHLHLDLIGTGAFALAALPNLLSMNTNTNTRILLSSGAVIIWASKLASFLFYRALKVHTDVRLEDTLNSTSGTIVFWMISLLWGIICSLPHTLGTTSSSPGSSSRIALVVGTVVYALGLATETRADYEKWMFKKDESNVGKFCNRGLWSVSQHPNFFGNLLLWSGILIMNFDSLISVPTQPINIKNERGGGYGMTIASAKAILGSWRAWASFLSPMFMWALFYGQSSGSITNTVELAMKKYGGPKSSYGDYVKTVPLIIPRFVGWIKCLFSFSF